MKQEPEDENLSRLLRDWSVDEALPPRFADRVWQRIEAEESVGVAKRAGFLPDWLTVLFARPAFAMVCAMALLVAGVSAGLVRANHDSARWDRQLAQRYVATVNPYNGQP